jgi:CheY-like chemotaxis protein
MTKVLVADDEVVSRRLIETSIRRWGYDPVREASIAARVTLQEIAPCRELLEQRKNTRLTVLRHIPCIPR